MTLKHTLSRAVSAATLAIASFFDGGLDKLISGFNRLDYDLGRYIERHQARAAQEHAARQASYARAQSVMDAEFDFQATSHNREDGLHREIARATRIRAKIADLIG